MVRQTIRLADRQVGLMRRKFAECLLEKAKTDKRIFLVTADLGFGMWDQFRRELPDQFLNTGASEQAALDICVGLWLSGKIPFFYTITPFILRGFETIRTYINEENMKIILVGSGRDQDYKHDGVSHTSVDIPHIMGTQLNMSKFYPINLSQINTIIEACLLKEGPSFISLRR